MNIKPFSKEFANEWKEIKKRWVNINFSYVAIIQFWLEGIGVKVNKSIIRHVLINGTQNWLILVLLGKIVKYQVKIPKDMEITPELNAAKKFDSRPSIALD